MNHAVEVLVYRYSVLLFVDERPHRVRDMNLVRKDDEALHGTIPVRLPPIAEWEPWEDAMMIGKNEAFGIEVTTDAQ